MRIIHTSDWQIGMTRHFLGAEAQARFTQDRIDAIVRLGELAEDHDAACIVVAGDIFETHALAPATVARAIEAMATSPVPVYLLPGNHDPLSAGSIWQSPAFAKRPEHIVLLDDSVPRKVPGTDNLEVVGAPWRAKQLERDPVAELASSLGPASGIRVAVAHGQTDALAPDPNKLDLIRVAAAEQALADGKFHYLALGDRHSATRVGDTGAIWFSGSPVATDYDEVASNKALVVELDEAGAKATEARVGRWQFLTNHFVFSADEDVDAVRQWLDDVRDKARGIVKISFEGAISLEAKAQLDSLMDEMAHRFASLYVRERLTNLAVVPESLERVGEGLAGYARNAWDELVARSRSDDAEAAQAAKDALIQFYRLMEVGDGR